MQTVTSEWKHLRGYAEELDVVFFVPLLVLGNGKEVFTLLSFRYLRLRSVLSEGISYQHLLE